jgi:tape measure domain
MDDRLGFELDINADTHSLPQSIQLLSQIDSKLGMIGKGLERFDQGTRKLNGATQGIRSMTLGFTELASALQLVERGLGAVTKLAGMASLGSSYAISAMGERSATIRAYTQLTGSKEQANLELYRAQSFAQKTDFTSEAIEKSQARLMAQGFRGQELYSTLFAASDLASIMPGNKNETLERVTMAMSQIRAKGKLQGEELTQQLAEAGLNTTLVKEQIKKSMGLKSTGEVDKLMGKGQITADIALPAIQRAILQQLGTSRAGEFATSSAGSVTALESNRAEAIKNVLKGFDADENLPAMDRYKKALTDQGRLFENQQQDRERPVACRAGSGKRLTRSKKRCQ